MKRRGKFRLKILLLLAVTSLLPLIIIAGSNLYLVIITRQQNIIELSQLSLDNAAEKINKYLAERSDGLNLVVSAPIDDLSEIPPENLYFLLYSSYNASNPNVIEMIDKQGQIIASMNKGGEAAFASAYLDAIEDERIIFAGKSKNDIRSLSAVEGDVAESSDFKAAIAGEKYTGLLEFVEGMPSIRMAGQIKNQSNQIIGVVSVEIELANVNSIVNNIKLGSEGYLYILDGQGYVIASGNEGVARIGRQSLKDVPLVEKVVSERTNLGDNDFITYTNTKGIKVVFAGTPDQETGWFLFSEWPVVDAFSILNNILLISTVISFGGLILVITIGLFLTNQIVKPINVLSGGARRISENNLDNKIELKTNDEFEVLADQFNEMMDILKENRKLRDEFVFIAAHELRTPVTAIKGYISMILDGTFGDAPDKIKEAVATVNKSNDRLVQLVQDLLEVARSEAGKMKIEMTKVNMNEQVDTVKKELEPLAKEKNIEIKYLSEENFDVMADTYKLNEVLVNIIGNAIKYTLTNGAIEISHEEKDGQLITHIKDHGMGMNKEQREKLFTKFYRVQTAETQKIEGTGLGLFICKEIVERMGGEIWVESEEGKGSVFSFSLKSA